MPLNTASLMRASAIAVLVLSSTFSALAAQRMIRSPDLGGPNLSLQRLTPQLIAFKATLKKSLTSAKIVLY